MDKIRLADVKNLVEYEKEREDIRNRIIQIKKARRVAVGDCITFVFENRETVLFQIQEMVRAERIVDEKKIQAEIDVYSDLLPGPGCLSATMFIEIAEEQMIRLTLERLLGITRFGTVWLQAGPELKVFGEFEAGREEEEAGRLSAVQYLKFHFDDVAVGRFMSEPRIELHVNHPNYSACRALLPESIQALRSDLM